MTPSFPLTRPTAINSQQEINPVHKIAFAIGLFEIWILFSRFFDQIASGYHIPAVVLMLLILTSVMSGKLLSGLGNRAGRAMLLWITWATLTLPFSLWKSNSLQEYEKLLMSLLFFAFISGLAATLSHIRQLFFVLAFSLLTTVLMTFVFGVHRTDRLVLSAGTYLDANLFAMCLLMVLPIWVFIISSSKSIFSKIPSVMCLLILLWTFVEAGSRGAMLGFIAVMGLVLIQSSIPKKIAITAALVCGVLLAASFMPSYIKARYISTFTGPDIDTTGLLQEDVDKLKGDLDSASGRKALLFRSIDITLENPIVGTGLGNFPVAVFGEDTKRGTRYAWFMTHNTYTQISSETGIPGLILYLAVIVCSFLNFTGVMRLTGPRSPNHRPEIWKAASYARLSLMGLSVCVFFLSVGYTPEVYVIAAISIALDRVARNSVMEQSPAAIIAPTSPVIPGFGRGPRLDDRYPAGSRWANINHARPSVGSLRPQPVKTPAATAQHPLNRLRE